MNAGLPIVQIEESLFIAQVNINDLPINKNEIRRSLGYEESEMSSHFESLVDEVLEELPSKCCIQAGYKILELSRIDRRNDGFSIAGKFIQSQSIIASQFRKAENAAVFVCTIGPGMENWSRNLASEGDGLLSFIVDAVASEAVEQATEFMHNLVARQMKNQNMNVTQRYSPGYCNWLVAEQHTLFSLLPENFCGITLTDSAMMIPVKSVSGIIGIGKDVSRKGYICDICEAKNCTYRAILSAKENRIK